MIESHYPTLTQLMSEQRARRNMILLGMLAALFIVCVAMGGLSYIAPKLPAFLLAAVGLSILALMVLPVIIWRNPHTAIYFLFAGVSLFGEGLKTRATIPTSYVPLWLNISSVGQIYGTPAFQPLVFSLAELMMIIATLSWVVRMVAMREFHFERGPFFGAILAYSGMVAFGFFNGLRTGADSTMGLYEVRAQAIFLLAYIMAANMITSRKQVVSLLWIGAVCAGILGTCGMVTYLTMPGPVGEEGFMQHDDSLEFNLLFFSFILACMARMDWKFKFWTFALVPTTLFAMLANQRRAGIAAFIIAFIPLMPILWAIMHERRKQISVFMIVFAIASAIYLPVAWNGEGAWALPARAIKSQSSPSARDASSDTYRLAEAANLRATRDTSPWIGFGYGKKFLQVVPLLTLTTDFLDYMPHNSVLWVWMRIGHIGFFLFWMMMATVIIKGLQILKEVRDATLQSIGVLAILFMIMMYTIGKYDMVLVNPRQMFLMGTLIGVLAVLKKIEKSEEETLETERPVPAA